MIDKKFINVEQALEFLDTAPTDSKNPLVIYHANCADGFSAAWCFHNAQFVIEGGFPECDFHPGVYNEPPPDVTDRLVYLVDFSYKRDVVEKMAETAMHIVLIDHHKTAIEDLAPLISDGTIEAYVDLERSGAMLAWDYLHNALGNGTLKPGDGYYREPPKLIEHVQDRDLWKFKLPGTREIQAGLYSYEYTFEKWDKLMSSNTADLLNLWNAGAAIERKHHKDIKELLNVCKRYMVIGGYNIPVASLPYTLTSDAGIAMAESHAEGTIFAACYWDTATHRIFSLRSATNGVDVSKIAFEYGGGGHKHAAGFRVERSHPLAQA